VEVLGRGVLMDGGGETEIAGAEVELHEEKKVGVTDTLTKKEFLAPDLDLNPASYLPVNEE
jgi:hypothetical protein